MVELKEHNSRLLAYERMAESFDDVMNAYDLERRLSVLIDQFLPADTLRDKLTLDAGTGTGRAAAGLSARGARVIALDYGVALATKAARRSGAVGAVGDIARLPFDDNTFDIVFSTEVIEHTPLPVASVTELYRVLKPGGRLVLSTPNRLWQPVVRLATRLRVRPYDGLENFLGTRELANVLRALGGTIEQHTGLHILPFQIAALRPLIRWVDRWGSALLPVMINQCVLVTKASAADAGGGSAGESAHSGTVRGSAGHDD